MKQFVPLREILATDGRTLVKLKKKYNQCATILNDYCEGQYLSAQKRAVLLDELFQTGKEINEMED
ncbi:hypothetical protein Q0590_21805 [Rhodocytophaga aerolata]|uniref:Uncharacterized protein n=1 Tax=Rhodocytophaga aerolata TaxID=455078 RepID=A0ABT8RCH6_9BACT|nr:hypothetical protein [Rhodocytophaga aerolata]MDO1448928.1 hypothetical protein [Rhodocytophaga aerolata]